MVVRVIQSCLPSSIIFGSGLPYEGSYGIVFKCRLCFLDGQLDVLGPSLVNEVVCVVFSVVLKNYLVPMNFRVVLNGYLLYLIRTSHFANCVSPYNSPRSNVGQGNVSRAFDQGLFRYVLSSLFRP